MENQEFNPYQNQQETNFVVQQNLPNSTPVLIMGILSIIGCCCYSVGLIFGIIGIVLANKDMKLYNANPTLFKNAGTLNTGKILCIIGIVMCSLSILFGCYLEFTEHGQELQQRVLEWQQEILSQQQNQ